MTEKLKIFLWGIEIGMLIWDNKNKNSKFYYNPEFINKKIEIAPLCAPLKIVKPYTFFDGYPDKMYQRLPPFIADSLPDQWGNLLFEQWRNENKIPLSEITPLDKLAFIGSRGMGALEYRPEKARFEDKNKIKLDELSRLAQKIYNERDNIRIDPKDSITLNTLISIGSSPGGQKPKAVIAVNTKTGELFSGQTAQGKEFKHYIVKFGNKERAFAEIEMTYYRMATEAGIPMEKSFIKEIDGTNHFFTERYDRKDGAKIHTQTLAAMNPNATSYEELIATCRKLNMGEDAPRLIFRQMVFNVISNNTDDHNKNFSFSLYQNGIWQLTPAYDINFIFTHDGYIAEKQHCLSIRGKLSNHTMQDILEFAKDNAINNPQAIIKAVVEQIRKFRQYAEEYKVPTKWIGRIENELNANLSNLGLSQNNSEDKSEFKYGNIVVKEATIIQQLKGNFEICAKIKNKTFRYILTRRNPEYKTLEEASPEQRSQMTKYLIKKYILPKYQMSIIFD